MKTIKVLSIVIIVLAVLNVAAHAGQVSRPGRRVAPRTVVLSLYNQHKRQSPFFQTRSRALLDRYFTRELADLIWQDARSSRGEVGALDGDPLYNAQDMQIKNFAVRERSVGTGTAEIAVSFENFNEKHEILFRLVPTGMSWKIADIAYDDGTTLLGILRRDRNSAEHGVRVKIYLVALGDNGRTGKKIGCEDSLVPVTRTISKTAAPLKAALAQLLATPQHPAENPKLENFWKGRDLKIKSVAIRNNMAMIYISGEVFVAGVCDIPRIESQIEQTGRQFPNVKRVKVFIGGRTLREALR
ncbi:MAG: DUF3828 domain-containing protein [Pyrinomonadaceae bacterium]|nr:DUF3828 domain-containing protein [Pyrinomonadaceae bacterium]